MLFKNKYSLLLLLLLFFSVSDAFAASDIVAVAENKAVNVFKAVRGIIFIVGGFGLVALAFFAIFGKLKWTWFASLAVGLAILAAAGAIIDYATTNSNEHVSSNAVGDRFNDTLSSAGR